MKNIVFTLGLLASLLGLYTFFTGKDLTSFKLTDFSGTWADQWGDCEQGGISYTNYLLRVARTGDHLAGTLSVYHRRWDERRQYDVDGRVEGNTGHVEILDRKKMPIETIAVARISGDEPAGLAIDFTSGNEGGLVFPNSVVCQQSDEDPSLEDLGWSS